MSKKYVYLFEEGDASMKNLLGGKGSNLAEMTKLGLPIPQGFIVTTEACTRYYDDGGVIADEIVDEIYESMEKLEKITGKKFGDPNDPFLVSIRSGARASMPGMMDTVLNLGLNDVAVEGMAKMSNNPRWAYDNYRRFIQMFADVVMSIEPDKFEDELHAMKEAKGVELDSDLSDDDMKELVAKFKEVYKKEQGEDFPQDAKTQLLESITAVFRSWDNPRAIVYRRMNDIPGDWGTAVNVQAMVFGNMGDTSGTGVAFTRDPATGEDIFYGEYLMNAQGEDVVAGIRTPEPISHLKDQMPKIYDEFLQYSQQLEDHYKDMQDLEFTIEDGKLYVLQTRSGKRTATAALKIAVDLYNEGKLTKEEALLQIDPRQLDALLHPTFDEAALKAAKPVATGLPASPGAANGQLYFTAEAAAKAGAAGEKVILARLETSPEDIEGMYAAEGILTARGGMTSHAAVVARGIGTCCVAGASDVVINADEKKMTTPDGSVFGEGDFVSLDGSTGNVYGEAIKTQEATVTGDFETVMGWADEVRTMNVRTNADAPADAKQARDYGAQGIGLTRTEHMFFAEDRIMPMREVIIARTAEQREQGLKKLLPMQKEDFRGIYKAMIGYPVTIRLLDPPLHEFLPTAQEDIEKLAKDMDIEVKELSEIVDSLHEFNPMLGHRGVRIAVTYPEIAVMQTRAIMEAAIEVSEEEGTDIIPEIMIPLVGEKRELKYVKDFVVAEAEAVMKEKGKKIPYTVGTMIEIPRACLLANEIAEEADFFSFGTNDLTQLTFGFSRDDAGTFLDDYYEKSIYEFDPFARLDQEGVGQLVEMAVERGRKVKPELKLGICGEHGGDPSTVEFCHKVGLDYVSCSPFRVPIARLSAAQAAIKEKNK